MLSFFLISQFLYEITRGTGKVPAVDIVKQWIEKISEKIGVVIRYTQSLAAKVRFE